MATCHFGNETNGFGPFYRLTRMKFQGFFGARGGRTLAAAVEETPPMRSFISWSRVRALVLSLVVASLAAPLAGCGKGPTIPGTEIPDSDANRAVIGAIERYRIAFVRKDPAGVLASAHPTYYDTAGTDDPVDDITYEELGPILRNRMAQLESVRFTIDYLDVHVHQDRALVKVWVDASFRLLPVDTAQPQSRMDSRFARVQDHNMFELVREGDSWLISAGM